MLYFRGIKQSAADLSSQNSVREAVNRIGRVIAMLKNAGFNLNIKYRLSPGFFQVEAGHYQSRIRGVESQSGWGVLFRILNLSFFKN